ncbi:MAG: lytic transglycosylase domain-containing protein [Dokdonella sp.]
MARHSYQLALIFAGCIGLVVTAHAGGDLYRCDGAHGEVAIVDAPYPDGHCKRVIASNEFKSKPPAPGSLAASSKVIYGERNDERIDQRDDERIDFRATSFGVVSTAPLAPGAVSKESTSSASTEGTKVAIAKPAMRVTSGSVYRVHRADGSVEYTNVKPRTKFEVLFTYYMKTCVACDVHSPIDWLHTTLRLDQYKDEIARAASDFGIDAALLRAVIHAESAFNPLALSAKGAQGLMQLMPGTASDLGIDDVFDPNSNIRGGAEYLSQLLKTFNGDERMATAAYNAGPGAVRKYGGVPPYDETKVYVQRVATLHERYRAGK